MADFISTKTEKYSMHWYEDNDEKGNEGALIFDLHKREGVVLDDEGMEQLREFVNAVGSRRARCDGFADK